MAEAGVFRNGDGIRFEPRAIQQVEIESAYFHGTPEACFEMRDQVPARGASPQRARESEACGKQRDGEDENPTQPFSFAHRDAKNCGKRQTPRKAPCQFAG